MPSIARSDAAGVPPANGSQAAFEAGKAHPAAANFTKTANRAIADSACDFILSVNVTHAEVENYARRLRERCDRTIAVCRG